MNTILQNPQFSRAIKGAWPLSVEQLKVTPEYSSDFTSDADSFGAGLNITATGNQTIGDRTGCLKLVDTVDNSLHWATRALTITNGDYLAVSFEYYIPSSNTNVDGFMCELGSSANKIVNDADNADTWTSVKWKGILSLSNNRIDFYLRAGGTTYIGNGTDYIGIRNIVISVINKTADLINGNHGTLNGVYPKLGPKDPAAQNKYEHDGASGYGKVTDEAKIQNIFDNGGMAGAWVYAKSDGEGSEARIFDKSKYYIRVEQESGGLVKVTFSYNFSGNDGKWTTTLAVLPINTLYYVGVSFNNSDVANNPTFKQD